jgi:myo-inositol-1(or 4)-monophosphatase
MTSSSSKETLLRIHSALEAGREVLNRFTPGAIDAEYKAGHDPVTEADRAVDAILKKHLLRDGEGWLSEETTDEPSRLGKTCVWVVDPLDGTREFVQGIPEFCISIAMVEKWKQFESAQLDIRPMGSVAYKLGLVAAGRADITFTLVPKHEWDVAAGAALVLSGDGFVQTLEHTDLKCNQKNPLITGLIACGPYLGPELMARLGGHLHPVER